MAYDFERSRINAYGELLQKDYQDYLQNGVPVEDQILSIAQGNESEDAAQRAMQLSDKSFDNAAMQTNRQLDRYGIRLNANQRDAKAREYGMAKILSRVSAANNTRFAESERQEQAKDTALNLGADLYNSSLNKLGYAAQGASQQIQYKENKKAQKKAGNLGFASQAIGMGAMVMLSDEDQKKDIKNNSTKSSLKNIMAMKTKRYRYKEGIEQPEGERVGILHQEAPESVKVETNEMKGVHLGDWVGELTGAVQELAARQDNLDRRGIKKLKRA